ncbi:sensor histidine kinase [Candidatus Neomarinimicrobiota bacterium]
MTFWPLNVIGWGAFFLINYLHFYLIQEESPSEFDWLIIATPVGFALTSLLRPLYKKLSSTSRTLIIVSIVFSASLGTAIVWFFISRFILIQVIEGHNIFSLLAHASIERLIVDLFYEIVIITSWSACYFVLKLWLEWDQQKEQARLASLKAQSAQIQMLQYRLNPQLIFSSLHTIRSLIDVDKHDAKNMVTQLSEFLRYSIVSKTDKVVPLSEDVDAVRNYLKIETRRYEENLKVDIEVEPPAGDFPVQNFLLQPLVENAIRVGMLTGPQPLRVAIHASINNSALCIRISSTGTWMEPEEASRFGDADEAVRLEEIRLRLISLYPNLQKFEVEESEDMVSVNIKIHKELD